ncbi:MAG: M56 family metallopeptidase [Planctomycetota bacterium]|jgi:beta-lactamase regulating signal transducer with metallopeptidase domain
MNLAHSWTDWVLQAATYSAVVTLLVAILWRFLKAKHSAHLGYALFLLPWLPLAFPPVWKVALPLPQSGLLATVIHERAAEAPRQAAETTLPVLEAPTVLGSSSLSRRSSLSTHVEPTTRTSTLRTSVWALWILITSTLLVRFLHTQLRTARAVRTSIRLPAADAHRIHSALRDLPRPARLQVRECSAVDGPSAWGVRHPLILFPPGMISTLDDRQLAWVLGHELAHHERNDLIASTLQRLIQIAWFFHPLVWWQSRQLNHLRECACDESAQAHTRTPGSSCAQALLQVANLASTSSTAPFALHTLHHDKQNMKSRIKRLMSPRRNAQYGMAPLAVPVLIFAAGCCLTAFRVQEPQSAADTAITSAHSWLIEQQAADGSWPAGPDLSATGEFNTVGITALVLSSMNHPGGSISMEQRSQATKRGLAFLQESMDAQTGIFGGAHGWHYMPSHAVATRTWLLARDRIPAATWKSIAAQALFAIQESRNPYGGWGYESPPTGDQNSFVTSLMLRTLATASAMGFPIDEDELLSPLHSMTWQVDPENGRIPFFEKGGHDARLVGKRESHPAALTELNTSIALVAAVENGLEFQEPATQQQSLALVAQCQPLWQDTAQAVDFYYWHFGSLAMQQNSSREQVAWNTALADALLPHQMENGSFPAADAWSASGASVHATVWATLALQAAAAGM